MKFILKVEEPWYDLNHKRQYTKEFKNRYGTWFVNLFSNDYHLFGFLMLKPAFKIDSSLIKLIRVEFIFRAIEIDATVDEKFLLFHFNPIFLPPNSKERKSGTCKLDVKIRMPQILFPSKIETGSSKRHLSELFNTGKLADVTIKSQGKKFKVHKLVIVRSDVFDRMLNNPNTKESQTGIIEINDIKHRVLYEMFRYLYTDEIPEIEEMALELLIAADKYNIPKLTANCGQYLMNNIDVKNFDNVLVTADNLNIKKLKDTAVDFIIKNRDTILSSEGWKDLKENYVQLAMDVLEKMVEISTPCKKFKSC